MAVAGGETLSFDAATKLRDALIRETGTAESAARVMRALTHAGLRIVPAAISQADAERVRELAAWELCRPTADQVGDPVQRVYQLTVWTLHDQTRRLLDGSHDAQQRAIEAEVSKRVARLMGRDE